MNSSWNLNNLPVQEASVLCHINADISGMKVRNCSPSFQGIVIFYIQLIFDLMKTCPKLLYLIMTNI